MTKPRTDTGHTKQTRPLLTRASELGGSRNRPAHQGPRNPDEDDTGGSSEEQREG